MKIGIPASSDTLEADLDPRFGRCQYFLIVDSDSMDLLLFQMTLLMHLMEQEFKLHR